MAEVVALRAKIYGYRMINKKLRRKDKKRCIVGVSFTFDGYKAFLFDCKRIYKEKMSF